MARSKTRSRRLAKNPSVDRKLVEELRTLLKPLPLDVLGHVASGALCCRNGTVALVKIDRTRILEARKRGT